MTFADHLRTNQDAHNGAGWMPSAKILVGDCIDRLKEIPDGTAYTCVTSPPYFGLRDYGVDGQIGLEATPDEFVAKMVQVFREVRRALRDDGTLWLNLGDSYAGGNTGGKWREGSASADGEVRDDEHSRRNRNGMGAVDGLKPKDLIGIPWRVAFALQADGWYLRQDIIWHKPNPMPESVRDRCTKAHEYLFLLSKSDRYYFDHEAMREPCSPDMQRRAALGHTRGAGGKIDMSRQDSNTLRGAHAKEIDVSNGRNRRSVWTVPTQPFSGAHFATFPPALVEPCILAGAPRGSVVLDPFSGAGTTGLVALRNERDYIGCELNPEYASMACNRIHDDAPMLYRVEVLP